MKYQYRKGLLQCGSLSAMAPIDGLRRLYCVCHTNEGDVIFHVALRGQALGIWQTPEGGDAGEDRICLFKSNQHESPISAAFI